MNWGKGIVGGMIVFMLFILSMCIYMFRMPADEYDHQYYEKGLGFDRDYAKQKRVSDEHAEPIISQKGRVLRLIFIDNATGSVKFIRPSSQALDKIFSIDNSADNVAIIPLAQVKTGQWKVVVEWESNHKAYLYQTEIYIK